MGELASDWDFWKTLIGIIGAWNIWLTIRVFALQQSLALNNLSDQTRGEAIQEVKDEIKALKSSIENLAHEIHEMGKR